MKRTLCKFFALVAVITLISVFVISCGEDDIAGSRFVDNDFYLGNGSGYLFDIRSPYQNVNWDTFGQFKAAQHAHTINSDGSGTMEQVLKVYYDNDYDIVGITDHVHAENHGRREPLNDPPGSPHRKYLNLINRRVTNNTWTFGGFTYNLTHITQQRLNEFQSGTAESSTRTVNRGMLVLAGTGELAPGGDPTPDEVNVFFWPDNVAAPNAWTVQLREGLLAVHRAGAIGFINHPGRSTHAQNFRVPPANNPIVDMVDPLNPSNQPAMIRRYANLYMEFPHSTIAGMEVFNRRDQDSLHDRILWDNVNKLTIPEGRFVWGYGNDDLHSFAVSATGSGAHINYNVYVMPSNTPGNLRYAMTNGHSYMVTVVAYNEGVNVPANSTTPRPAITKIDFVPDTDVIQITATNATRIDWISDGRIIRTTTGNFGSLDLSASNNINNVGTFIRANIIGPGGMAVTQPISTKRK